MAESMQRLFLLSVAAFVIFLLLYLLMFQGAEKKTLGTLRSLGNSPPRTGAYLFGGGFIIAAGGVLIATLAGGLIMRRVQEKILADALAGIDTTVRGHSLVLGEQVLLPALSALAVGILTRQPLTALLYFACHLIGCFLAVLRPALATPTKLLRVQE